MKILRWSLFVIAALIVVLSVVLYFASPTLASLMIERQAATYGLAVQELQVRRPGWNRWRAERIEVVGLGYAVRALELEIAYTWQSLMSGRATQIRLAELTARSVGDADASELEVGAILLQLPEQIDTLWRELPADRLRIEKISLSSAGFAAAGQLDGELEGELTLSPAAITMQGTADDFRLSARVEREGGLRLEVAAAQSFARLEAQRDITGTAAVDWTFDDLVHVSGNAPFAIDRQGWSLGAGLTVVAALREDYALDARIEIADVRGGWDKTSAAPLRASVGWQGGVAQGEARLEGVGKAELTLDGSQLLIEILPASEFSSAALRTEDIALIGARVILPKAVALRAQLPDARLTLQQAEFDISADSLRWLDYQVSPRLAVSVAELEADSTGAVGRFAVEWSDLQLNASGAADVDLESSVWKLDVDLQQALFPELPGALGMGELDYGVDAGSLAAKLRIRGKGSDSYAGDGSLTLHGLAAHYDDVTARKIAGVLHVQFSDQQWWATSSKVTVGEVDVGFPITDLRAELSAGREALSLNNMRGTTLGGDLLVEELHYDLAKAESEFLLAATGIQLSQVLALEGDTLTGRAILDGQLPVRVLGSEVSIASGKFSVREPGGVLHYAGAQAAAQSLDQTGIGFAIAALADFQFDVLDVGVEYSANGDLLLGVRLEGFNADFEDGRPIHYNLNVTENIPVLLESLQLSDEVGRRLEQRLLD